MEILSLFSKDLPLSRVLPELSEHFRAAWSSLWAAHCWQLSELPLHCLSLEAFWVLSTLCTPTRKTWGGRHLMITVYALACQIRSQNLHNVGIDSGHITRGIVDASRRVYACTCWDIDFITYKFKYILHMILKGNGWVLSTTP